MHILLTVLHLGVDRIMLPSSPKLAQHTEVQVVGGECWDCFEWKRECSEENRVICTYRFHTKMASGHWARS